jgi:pilus assembly protein Flp/PilA
LRQQHINNNPRSLKEIAVDLIVVWTRLAAVARAKVRSDSGAALVEYALLVALIAVVCIAAVTFLGSSASGQMNTAGNSIGA